MKNFFQKLDTIYRDRIILFHRLNQEYPPQNIDNTLQDLLNVNEKILNLIHREDFDKLLVDWDIEYDSRTRTYHLMDFRSTTEGETGYYRFRLSKKYMVVLMKWLYECNLDGLPALKVEQILSSMKLMAKIAKSDGYGDEDNVKEAPKQI